MVHEDYVRNLRTLFVDTGTYKCLHYQKLRWMSSSLWGLECSPNDYTWGVQQEYRTLDSFWESGSLSTLVPIYLKDFSTISLEACQPLLALVWSDGSCSSYTRLCVPSYKLLKWCNSSPIHECLIPFADDLNSSVLLLYQYFHEEVLWCQYLQGRSG